MCIRDRAYRNSLLAGGTLTLALVVGFFVQWNLINQQIKLNYYSAEKDKELPTWVALSSVIEDNWVTHKILKSRLVYSVANTSSFGFTPRRSRSFDEPKKHDPLVVVASLFSEPLDLSRTEQVKLLNAVFDQRHQTERKLWSGRDLSTTSVETSIQFFPEYRLSYTEKVIKIKNSHKWKRNQQEALYSFYLPEGSVVTSASLWVAGEERPSFLTTRNKADSVYTTIVGRERRDPLVLSLIHI